jgi:hypothetical protein
LQAIECQVARPRWLPHAITHLEGLFAAKDRRMHDGNDSTDKVLIGFLAPEKSSHTHYESLLCESLLNQMLSVQFQFAIQR